MLGKIGVAEWSSDSRIGSGSNLRKGKNSPDSRLKSAQAHENM